jgi:hypothetical protein
VPLFGEVDEHTWIKVPRSRPHDQASRRGEAHGRVHGAALNHRSHAGAASKVGNDRASKVRRTDGRDDVLVGQSVKTVAADPGFMQGLRNRIALGDLG